MQFSPFRYFPYFPVKTLVTPTKYERDWKYPTHTFVKSKFPATEKLTNGALVTPTPDIWSRI